VFDPARGRAAATGYETPALEDLVIYELHVGTFSADGTFDGAIEHLPELAALGVNAIEVMPVAEFPGRHGWGYDGVYLSAAQSSYGGPEAFQRLVDAAHRHGLAVILDVVYNHVGASGTQALDAFGPYFTGKYETFWGKAINYDDEHADAVREWVLQSAEGWIRDFRVDGLRLDAIHAIFDSSAEHLVAAIARRVHRADHRALVIAESGLNDPKVMRPSAQGGWGCDAAWADDFHHALRTLVTEEREGYYEEFGRVTDLAKAFHRPHVHDGVYSTFRKRRFGAPAADIGPERFVVFTQNHDQVGNRALGDRLPAEAQRLAAFCVLLSPFTPMLWQGEEYGETAPFQFFSDHIDEEIATATREGRRREFASFAAFAGEEVPDPQDPATFERSKLTRERDEDLLELYRRLIAARRSLTRADAQTRIDHDEGARWLRVRRGDHVMACNFARERAVVPLDGGADVLLCTHEAKLVDGGVELPALAGALIR
jgi:maltooligosyltrehalose trehalohydrolase